MVYEDGYFKTQFRWGFFIDAIYEDTWSKGLLGEFLKKTILAF